MNEVGIDVKSIKIEKKVLPQDSFPEELRNLMVELSKKDGSNPFEEIKTVFKNDLFELSLRDESSGTQRLYDFLSVYLRAMEGDKVLICDELERAIHPEIVKHLVAKVAKNKDSSMQLIGATHSMELLDQSLVRRDQVFFTQLEKEYRSTNLYSLWDIKNVRNTENLRSNYLAGKYGGIPFIRDYLEEGSDE